MFSNPYRNINHTKNRKNTCRHLLPLYDAAFFSVKFWLFLQKVIFHCNCHERFLVTIVTSSTRAVWNCANILRVTSAAAPWKHVRFEILKNFSKAVCFRKNLQENVANTSLISFLSFSVQGLLLAGKICKTSRLIPRVCAWTTQVRTYLI